MARSVGDRSMGDHALWATRRRRPCATRPEARLRKPCSLCMRATARWPGLWETGLWETTPCGPPAGAALARLARRLGFGSHLFPYEGYGTPTWPSSQNIQLHMFFFFEFGPICTSLYIVFVVRAKPKHD
jgi:hypothetical protein